MKSKASLQSPRLRRLHRSATLHRAQERAGRQRTRLGRADRTSAQAATTARQTAAQTPSPRTVTFIAGKFSHTGVSGCEPLLALLDSPARINPLVGTVWTMFEPAPSGWIDP